ncbi:MAG: 16S rRNA (uracil(1498)-N(3))-methyltransferase [Coriobacteriales bacterium]|nr:16S rRNA (uracil(1498)-N(3))-methyltransferase [Coriobacteriales bacterium]
MPHFFIEEGIEGFAGETVNLPLPEEVVRHLLTLRLKAHEHIVCVDAPGHGWELELTKAPGKVSRKATGRVVERAPVREAPGRAPARAATQLEGVLVAERVQGWRPNVILIQGISATDRMDKTIRQTTELGISRVIPLESERSTVSLNAVTRAAKHERWQRIARSAAEQSAQLLLPVIERPRKLFELEEAIAGYDELLFFWEEPGGVSVSEALRSVGAPKAAAEVGAEGDTETPNCRIAVIVGPEGGFSAQEATWVKQAGGKTITLGETILRTETAAVVACALVLYHLGALGQAGCKGAL